MKIRNILFIVTIFAIVSAACDLPFTSRAATPTVSPTLTLTPPEATVTLTGSPSPSPIPSSTSAIVSIATPTAAATQSLGGGIGSNAPTTNPTPGIPVTGASTQPSASLFTFAPTANPQKIFVGSCGANQTTITVVVNEPAIVGSMLLFDRLDQAPDGSATAFGTGTTMNAIDVGKYQATITAPSATAAKKAFNTVLDYKFAVLDIGGKLVASSFVYSNIAVEVCKK